MIWITKSAKGVWIVGTNIIVRCIKRDIITILIHANMLKSLSDMIVKMRHRGFENMKRVLIKHTWNEIKGWSLFSRISPGIYEEYLLGIVLDKKHVEVTTKRHGECNLHPSCPVMKWIKEHGVTVVNGKPIDEYKVIRELTWLQYMKCKWRMLIGKIEKVREYENRI